MPDNRKIFADRPALCAAAAQGIVGVIQHSLNHRGRANIVLTGGGTGIGTLASLATLLDPQNRGTTHITVPNLEQVHFWFGDERFVPEHDAERNVGQAYNALFTRLLEQELLPEQNIHAVSPSDSAPQVDHAARDYAQALADRAVDDPSHDPRLPYFDLVLLGMGDDAHVASLFPGLPGPHVTGETVIGVTGSPKPPPVRVSLTVEALNTAQRIWFLVAGAEKAEAVSQVRQAQREGVFDPQRMPASLMRATAETQWWLDQAASTA